MSCTSWRFDETPRPAAARMWGSSISGAGQQMVIIERALLFCVTSPSGLLLPTAQVITASFECLDMVHEPAHGQPDQAPGGLPLFLCIGEQDLNGLIDALVHLSVSSSVPSWCASCFPDP